MNGFWRLLVRLRPEDPRRLRVFMQSVQDLDWSDARAVSSLSALFKAVDGLAEAEVAYYFRRRGTRAWISGTTRTLAWGCGSIGLVLPLLASADVAALRDVGQYGYAFLAVAASFLAANSLFGGSEGHIRFVGTQLRLEKLMTASRIQWCRYLSESPSTKEELARGFDIVLAYAEELHTTTIGETGEWGASLLAALKGYRDTVNGGSAGVAQPDSGKGA